MGRRREGLHGSLQLRPSRVHRRSPGFGSTDCESAGSPFPQNSVNEQGAVQDLLQGVAHVRAPIGPLLRALYVMSLVRRDLCPAATSTAGAEWANSSVNGRAGDGNCLKGATNDAPFKGLGMLPPLCCHKGCGGLGWRRMAGNSMPGLAAPTGPPPPPSDHRKLAAIARPPGHPGQGQAIQNKHFQGMRLTVVVAQFGPPVWPQIPVQGVYREKVLGGKTDILGQCT